MGLRTPMRVYCTTHWLITAVLLTISLVESLIVTTEQGIVNGTYSTSRRGKIFNAFYGIPYAQPPVGKLRFKPPKYAKPWTGVLDSSITPTGSLRIPFNTSQVEGDEDCLKLNVYTPLNARKGDNLAVMVFLVGGTFHLSSNMDPGPQYIMDQNVVLVIPNYRLGALGLLTTGDAVISGNYQLKDQTMALKWIQQNIRNFGGDPNNVTLHGHSSGSTCAHLHTVSPSSKGLFHRIIMQSSNEGALFYKRDVIRGIVEEFATKAGCPNTTTSESIYECLMALDAKEFPIIEQTMPVWYAYPTSIFLPTIEDEYSEEPFITSRPSSEHYHSPSMPWIIGFLTSEGAFKAVELLQKGGNLAAEVDQHYKLLFPIMLGYLWNTKLSYLDNISRTLRSHYFGNRKIGAETSHEITKLFTDGVYGVPIISDIRRYPGPKYVYWFDYRSNYLAQNIHAYYEQFLGVSHETDLTLIYSKKQSAPLLTNRDHMFSEELVKRWVNFVQTGNPNHPIEINEDVIDYWNPMVSDRIEYLLIKLNGTMETDLYKGTYDFWTSLPIGVV
ncbi:carboxylic ester hydrolase-like [Planococcus citri]|uniref:carboxylic ester hydrolase-like n=1 Tax=Planococcus citri TaxID=170843 RepID=UPI0031FA38F1